MSAERRLVQVDLRFVTTEDPKPLADRVEEAVRAIVGRDALEEFRVRTLPLHPTKPRLRPVE